MWKTSANEGIRLEWRRTKCSAKRSSSQIDFSSLARWFGGSCSVNSLDLWYLRLMRSFMVVTIKELVRFMLLGLCMWSLHQKLLDKDLVVAGRPFWDK